LRAGQVIWLAGREVGQPLAEQRPELEAMPRRAAADDQVVRKLNKKKN